MNTSCRWSFCLLACAMAFACNTSIAGSAEEAKPIRPAQVSSTSSINIEQLERAIAELEQSTTITAEDKAEATENYRAAITNLQSAAGSDARLKALIAETESVSSRVSEMKTQRDETKNKKPFVDPRLSLT